jgi:hypothetical protein
MPRRRPQWKIRSQTMEKMVDSIKTPKVERETRETREYST